MKKRTINKNQHGNLFIVLHAFRTSSPHSKKILVKYTTVCNVHACFLLVEFLHSLGEHTVHKVFHGVLETTQNSGDNNYK